MNTKINPDHDAVYDKIEESHIYQELESRKFIEKFFDDILMTIKKSNAYIHLKNIALLHFTCIMSGDSELSANSEIEKKKAQTTQIGFLSDAIGSTITRLVAEKLKSQEVDIQIVIKEIIKKLIQELKNSSKKTTLTDKLSSKRKKSDEDEPFNLSDADTNSNEDSDHIENSLSKKLPQRTRKPNTKYFSEEIVSSVTDCYFDENSTNSFDENKRKKRKL